MCNEAVGFVKGKWSKEDAVQYTENRSVCTDAKCEGEDRNRGESWLALERAKCEPQIVCEPEEQRPPPSFSGHVVIWAARVSRYRKVCGEA